jgi:hypothetical protein
MSSPIAPFEMLPAWSQYLQAADYATAAVKGYAGAVDSFRAWHGEQEQRPTEFADLTPIAFMGYRRALQQTCAISTTNLHAVSLRSWCQWLTDRRSCPW